MMRFIALVDCVNGWVGRRVAWLMIALVLLQFSVVVLRYVFAVGFVWLQEAILYLYGASFMLAAGYAFLLDEHVRLDVIYRGAAPRTRAWIDLAGSLLLALPFCVAVFWYSAGYVLGAWSVTERSGEALGLPVAFAYKTLIWVFAVLLGLQGMALALRCAAFLTGRTDTYPPSPGTR